MAWILPVVVLRAGHEAESGDGLARDRQPGRPLLQKAVERLGVAGESLLVGPELAVILQPAARLTRARAPRVEPWPLCPVKYEVVTREVCVDVGTFGQRQPVSRDGGPWQQGGQ